MHHKNIKLIIKKQLKICCRYVVVLLLYYYYYSLSFILIIFELLCFVLKYLTDSLCVLPVFTMLGYLIAVQILDINHCFPTRYFILK